MFRYRLRVDSDSFAYRNKVRRYIKANFARATVYTLVDREYGVDKRAGKAFTLNAGNVHDVETI